MSKTRWLKIGLIVGLSIVAMLFVELAPETAVVTIAGFFVLAVGAFLQTDIKKMVAETRLLKPGEFENMKTWKYLLSAAAFAILTGRTLMLEYYVAAGTFGGGLYIVAGSLLAGLNQNKEATGITENTVSNDAPDSNQSGEDSTGA
jgi:hypothetical protein